jgi:hypothetical protein
MLKEGLLREDPGIFREIPTLLQLPGEERRLSMDL